MCFSWTQVTTESHLGNWVGHKLQKNVEKADYLRQNYVPILKKNTGHPSHHARPLREKSYANQGLRVTVLVKVSTTV